MTARQTARAGLAARIGAGAVMGAGLLLALAATMGPPPASSGAGASLDVHVPYVVQTVVVGLLGLSTLILFSLVRRGRPSPDGPRPRPLARRLPAWAATLVSILPLLLLTLLWSLAGDRWGGADAGDGQGALAALSGLIELLARARKPATSLPLFDQAIAALLVVAALAIFAVIVLVAVAERLEQRSEGRARAERLPADGADDDGTDLRVEPDARAAIIRAYRRFERAAAAARAPRARWQTPAEFMRSTLACLPVPAAPVQRLTTLFEIARFSDRALEGPARDAACDCLDEITAALAGEPAHEG